MNWCGCSPIAYGCKFRQFRPKISSFSRARARGSADSALCRRGSAAKCGSATCTCHTCGDKCGGITPVGDRPRISPLVYGTIPRSPTSFPVGAPSLQRLASAILAFLRSPSEGSRTVVKATGFELAIFNFHRFFSLPQFGLRGDRFYFSVAGTA